MSIATLKRKSQTKYNNMSVNSQMGFSLNGTTRNQGYIGQTSLSRSITRTLMKGDTIKGHGGCCGTYLIDSVVKPCVTSLNDNTIIKKSVLNSSGLKKSAKCNIVDKTKYIPYNPTKRSPCKDVLCNINDEINTNCIRCKNKTVRELHVKPKEYYTTMTSSDYLIRIHKGLDEELKNTHIPIIKTSCGVPLPN